MRSLLIIGGICLIAIVGGAALYVLTLNRPSPGANANTEVPEAKNVAFKVLDEGENAKAMFGRKNYAIYDPLEFQKFWTSVHGGKGPPAPIVNFDTHYVIAVFAGAEPRGGYSIGVSSITDTGDARSVAVLIQEPDADCVVIEEQSHPYQFVSVPFSEAEALAHTDVVAKKSCK
jgi:hypothetical protein